MKDSIDLLREDMARSARVASGPKTKAGGVPFPFDRVDTISANPREQLVKPYRNSVWVMRAIKKIAGPISAVPIDVMDIASEKPIEDPDLMAFLKAPVKNLDGDDFNEAAVGWLKLAGECFLIAGDDWLLPFPTKLTPLIMPRPDQMRHVVVAGELVGWEYRDLSGGRHMLLPEQVWQKKYWNPYDQWRGLSEFEAARIAAESDYYAGEFVRNLMANNGDQGVYIVAKNGIPNDAQRAQIIADLREKRARAQRGEFRAVFLTGDIEVQDPKIAAPDGDLVANRLQNRHEVFIAFGVPASMADVQASYSIGSASARFELIEETCIPTSRKIAALLEGPAARAMGRPVTVRHDWDEHSTMQAVRRERLDAGQKLWASGMSWEDVNEYLRLGMEAFDGWDVGYIPFNVQPVGANGPLEPETSTSSQFAEPGDDEGDMGKGDDSVEQMMRALKRGRPAASADQGDEFQIFACTCHGGPVSTRERDPKRVKLWQKHAAQRRPTIKEYESRIGRVLAEARAESLRKVERLYKKGVTTRAAAADLVFDQKTFADGFFAQMRKQAAVALTTAGQQLYDEIGRDDAFKVAPESVLNFVRTRENKLSDVPDEIHSSVMAQIEEGVSAGDTMDELADRVRSAFNDISKGRARVIASTETAAAYGSGRDQAMRDAGVQWKQWLTSGNANVREAHAEAEGQTVQIDEPFIVGGEELMHPGDTRGSAGNVINCHCVSIAVAKPSQE